MGANEWFICRPVEGKIMKRFNFNDDEYHEDAEFFDDFDEDGLSPDEYKAIMEEQSKQIELQAIMMQEELNHTLVF